MSLINPVIIEYRRRTDRIRRMLKRSGQDRCGDPSEPCEGEGVTMRIWRTFTLEGEELLARAICHELDHLDGKLYVDMRGRRTDGYRVRIVECME